MGNPANPQDQEAQRGADRAGPGTALDPVCGMDVDASDPSVERAEWQDKTYYFCSPACRHAFESSPQEYVI